MRIATGMSLTAPEPEQRGHLCNLRNQAAVICSQVPSEEDSDLHGCFNQSELSSDKRQPSLSFEDKSHSPSFHLLANEWLGFCLFLVASSYLLSVNIFRSCRIKSAKKVSLPHTIIPNARTENVATAVNSMSSCSESSGSPHKSDASEISDLDRASYWDSLLSLEEEDTEWLSDSKPCESSPENPSTPLSYKCDSLSEISDIGSPTYWDSLLRLEEKHDEWVSDSEQELGNVQDGSPSPFYKGTWGVEVIPSISNVSSLTTVSTEHLFETADTEEFNADEPLFWPLEGKQNWNSEESWSSFCSSPRRKLVFDSISPTSTMKEFEKKGYEAVCSVKSKASTLSMWSKSSAKIVPLECEDEKVVSERGEALSKKVLSLRNTFVNEDFASNDDLPLGTEYFALDAELPIETLVGLKEFDGHEGLDSEFNGAIFMLDEYLQ